MPRTLLIFGIALGVAGAFTAIGAQAQPSEEARQDKARQDEAETPSEALPAPEKIGPQERKRAREAYQAGQDHFEAGHYEEALEAFQRAYDAVPNPVVLISIAETQARLGRENDAVETLEQYLEEKPEAADRYAIEAKIKSLRTRPAVLAVSSDPSNAQIIIDGAETGETTPAELELPPGEHKVKLRLAGYEAREETLQLEPGEHESIDRRLEASTAVVEDEVFGEQGAEATAAQAPPVSTQAAPGDTGPSTAVWIATGVGGAALVTGTVLGFLALAEESDFSETHAEETAERGERFALFADVAFGVGAVSLTTALVLYLTESSGDEEARAAEGASLRASPWVSKDGVGLGAKGRF